MFEDLPEDLKTKVIELIDNDNFVKAKELYDAFMRENIHIKNPHQ